MRDETIEQVEYSDGFGRLIQARAQAEDNIFGRPAPGKAVPARGDAGLPLGQSQPPGPAEGRKREDIEPPNVAVSGWKTYDNKGRVVESYEPFFDRGWSYRAPTADQQGQSTRKHYDPRGQGRRVASLRSMALVGPSRLAATGRSRSASTPGPARCFPSATSVEPVAQGA